MTITWYWCRFEDGKTPSIGFKSQAVAERFLERFGPKGKVIRMDMPEEAVIKTVVKEVSQ